MPNALGTLAGLIVDLEGLHRKVSDQEDSWCSSCKEEEFYEAQQHPWPCPTIELVQKHKRALYKDSAETGCLLPASGSKRQDGSP